MRDIPHKTSGNWMNFYLFNLTLLEALHPRPSESWLTATKLHSQCELLWDPRAFFVQRRIIWTHAKIRDRTLSPNLPTLHYWTKKPHAHSHSLLAIGKSTQRESVRQISAIFPQEMSGVGSIILVTLDASRHPAQTSRCPWCTSNNLDLGSSVTSLAWPSLTSLP